MFIFVSIAQILVVGKRELLRDSSIVIITIKSKKTTLTFKNDSENHEEKNVMEI